MVVTNEMNRKIITLCALRLNSSWCKCKYPAGLDLTHLDSFVILIIFGLSEDEYDYYIAIQILNIFNAVNKSSV